MQSFRGDQPLELSMVFIKVEVYKGLIVNTFVVSRMQHVSSRISSVIFSRFSAFVVRTGYWFSIEAHKIGSDHKRKTNSCGAGSN